MNSTKRGFTLLELLTVVGMIVLIMGSMTAAVSGAHERARVQKAQADVKSITQAVLGYENHAKNYTLPTMTDEEISKSSKVGFLFGNGPASETGEKVPVILQASLSQDGVMRDPWGTPYKISIRVGQVSIKENVGTRSMKTNYVVPNFNRLTKEERE